MVFDLLKKAQARWCDEQILGPVIKWIKLGLNKVAANTCPSILPALLAECVDGSGNGRVCHVKPFRDLSLTEARVFSNNQKESPLAESECGDDAGNELARSKGIA